MGTPDLDDPWRKGLWPWQRIPSMLQFSQRWVVVFIALNVVIILWLGITWTMNGMKLNKQDAQLASIGEEVDWLSERVEWGESFVRTGLALTQASKQNLNGRQILQLSEILWSQSRNYGFDPLLIIAVMHRESRTNPFARGRYLSGAESGAYGLMQLKVATAQIMGRQLGITVNSAQDLMKPDVNLMLGTYYLLRQIVRYGNVSKGLMAYNIGPYALEKRLRSGEHLPQAYSRGILLEYKRLTETFGDP